MRVKHARDVLASCHGASSLLGRPHWQRAVLLAARGLASCLRWAVCAPVWAGLGGLLRQGAVQLERWIYRL